jgi:carboxypeptidase family protein
VAPVLVAGALAACARGRPVSEGAPPATDSAWLASVGFPLRERVALLHLSRSEISALDVDSVAQLLQRAPRVEVSVRADRRKNYRLHGSANWATSPGTDPGCDLDFYINGNRLQIRDGGISELLPDRLLHPLNFAGIEVFAAAEAPVGDPSGCGAVLYWIPRMRERDDPPFTSSLNGRVLRLPGGAGLAGVTVTAEPGGRARVTDARGRFDFGAVPAALYRLEADVPEWGKYRADLALRSGGVGEVVIEIERR